MKGKEKWSALSGSYGIKLPESMLRFPPVSKDKRIEREYDYAKVKIEKPLDLQSWRTLLVLLRYGKYVDEDNRGVCIELELEFLMGALRETNWNSLKENFYKLFSCWYSVIYLKENREVLFHILETADFWYQKGKVKVWVSKPFLSFLENSGLWYYYAFAFFLRKPSAINLHAFLTANTTINKLNISTALERARINISKPTMAKKYLFMALDELVGVGFLKGYRVEGDQIVLERFSDRELQLKAIELQKKIEEQTREFMERIRKTKRESERRRRERKKKSLDEFLDEFPF